MGQPGGLEEEGGIGSEATRVSSWCGRSWVLVSRGRLAGGGVPQGRCHVASRVVC